MRTATKFLALALIALAASTAAAGPAKGSYASVNGVNMYYEVTGKGRPIVLIHGAFCTIDGCFSKLVELLSKNRQVIAVELQGHGHTADVDGRPLRTTTMADDVAALLDKLKIANADVYGYSMGGGVATQLAIRHPRLVGKLVIAGAALTKDGSQPGITEMIKAIKPEQMEQSPFGDAYKKVSPHPDKFRTLVTKIQNLESFDGYKVEDLKKIKSPVLFLLGDADGPTVEHGAAMLRLFGGGAFGDTGQPRAKSQLAILPGTSHIELVFRADWIAAMVTAFLDAK
ncbi:MAG: alpha/beta hydrolase [Deltaproteobacteria bacterium]|nr:alpha/beta hydrolase [Deltaproteobacteria bacterium]